MLINTFSGFSIENEHRQPVTPDLSPKVIEILCYLLLRSPRPARRDQIIADIFPDVPGASSRNALSTLLSRLRAGIRASALSDKMHLYSSSDSVGVCLTEDCDMDVLVLDRTLNRIGQAGESETQASNCNFSGRFLAGFDADWVICERTRLQHRQLELLRYHTCRAVERGDLEQACEHFETALGVDDFLEYAHLGLMVGLAGTGQRVRALKRFQTYRDIMRGEMHMDVLPEAKKLVHAINSGACSRSYALRFISEQVL